MENVFSDIAKLAGLAWEPLGAEASEAIVDAIATDDGRMHSKVLAGGARVYTVPPRENGNSTFQS